MRWDMTAHGAGRRQAHCNRTESWHGMESLPAKDRILSRFTIPGAAIEYLHRLSQCDRNPRPSCVELARCIAPEAGAERSINHSRTSEARMLNPRMAA